MAGALTLILLGVMILSQTYVAIMASVKAGKDDKDNADVAAAVLAWVPVWLGLVWLAIAAYKGSFLGVNFSSISAATIGSALGNMY